MITESQKRYNQSEKHRVASWKYRQSEKGKINIKKQTKSEARKMAKLRYVQSEKGKITSSKATKKHLQTEKGKGTQSKYKKSEKGLASQRKSRYGLSPSDYSTLIENQEGKCVICQRLDDNLHIDHDHATGKVRGLLCHNCNVLLGFAGENITILSNAIKYLERTK